jgi:hypothetical protein
MLAEYTYLVRNSDGVLVAIRTEGTYNGRTVRREMALIGEQ